MVAMKAMTNGVDWMLAGRGKLPWWEVAIGLLDAGFFTPHTTTDGV